MVGADYVCVIDVVPVEDARASDQYAADGLALYWRMDDLAYQMEAAVTENGWALKSSRALETFLGCS